jgi:hypothetical protein
VRWARCGRGRGSLIEERAALKTTGMGTAVEYGPNGLAAPRTL